MEIPNPLFVEEVSLRYVDPLSLLMLLLRKLRHVLIIWQLYLFVNVRRLSQKHQGKLSTIIVIQWLLSRYAVHSSDLNVAVLFTGYLPSDRLYSGERSDASSLRRAEGDRGLQR